MKIPDTLKIGNIPYKVHKQDQEDLDGYCGKGNLAKQWLKINTSMPQEMQEETFWHEVIHQILDQRSFRDESKNEQLIDTLAGGLYQVLNENDLLKKDV